VFGNLFVVTSILVVPYFFPVTSPVLFTVAMLSSCVLYDICSFVTWSNNMLNPRSVFASICFVILFYITRFMMRRFLVFTFRLASEMLVGSVVVLVESSPISPFPLYPTVYTSPKSSAIADV